MSQVTMKNAISIAQLIPLDALAANTDGAAVDMLQHQGYETALALLDVGAITGTPTSVTVVVEESDAEAFGSGVETLASQVVAAETLYQLQVARTKRYIRARVTFAGGTDPTAEVSCQALLTNWALPFNIV